MKTTEEAGAGVRAQEEIWRHACKHSEEETRKRFRALAHVLPITGLEEVLMVDAAMAASRYYARELAYANYRLRTGCSYPAEGRGQEEEREQGEWEAALRRLGSALRV
jgi:hypothetical protein